MSTVAIPEQQLHPFLYYHELSVVPLYICVHYYHFKLS